VILILTAFRGHERCLSIALLFRGLFVSSAHVRNLDMFYVVICSSVLTVMRLSLTTTGLWCFIPAYDWYRYEMKYFTSLVLLCWNCPSVYLPICVVVNLCRNNKRKKNVLTLVKTQ